MTAQATKLFCTVLQHRL